MTRSTTEARTQLVLAVVAMTVGGVVFALAGDFVVAVGVGAAVFALARQAVKVWGPKRGSEPDIAGKADGEPARR